MQIRELTGRERQEICRLVKTMCATYDYEYGCLALSCECFMFSKVYTGGALCKWFRNALLPLNRNLERLFTDDAVETKPCKICGKEFSLNGRQAYCSDKCLRSARKAAVARNVRSYRERRNVIN